MNISPVDGRYERYTKPLPQIMSEFGLSKYRIEVMCATSWRLARTRIFRCNSTKPRLKRSKASSMHSCRRTPSRSNSWRPRAGTASSPPTMMLSRASCGCGGNSGRPASANSWNGSISDARRKTTIISPRRTRRSCEQGLPERLRCAQIVLARRQDYALRSAYVRRRARPRIRRRRDEAAHERNHAGYIFRPCAVSRACGLRGAKRTKPSSRRQRIYEDTSDIGFTRS